MFGWRFLKIFAGNDISALKMELIAEIGGLAVVFAPLDYVFCFADINLAAIF